MPIQELTLEERSECRCAIAETLKAPNLPEFRRRILAKAYFKLAAADDFSMEMVTNVIGRDAETEHLQTIVSVLDNVVPA